MGYAKNGEFSPEERMEGIFVYVLEFMLTLEYYSTLMHKISKSEDRANLKLIKALHTVRIVLYIGCSDPVIGSSTAYKLITFRPSTTGTKSLTTGILRTATKWHVTSQTININMQNLLFLHIFVFFIM